MAEYTDLSAAYSRTPIVVWVEDDLTKQYLTEVWNDNGVSLLIAGSNEAVHAVVGDADLEHVFGIVDRDFGRTNYENWMNPDSSFKVFRLPVSEIENYLLDAQCIAGCNVNFNHRSESEIEERIAGHAQTMVCWLACRDVLADYHDDPDPAHVLSRWNIYRTGAGARSCGLEHIPDRIRYTFYRAGRYTGPVRAHVPARVLG